MLTKAQIVDLRQRAGFWSAVIREADIEPESEGLRIAYGHLLVIALQHLANCLGFLVKVAPHPIAQLGTEFIDEWERDRDTRNILEHEEEYLAGGGRFRSRLEDESQASSPRIMIYVAGHAQAFLVLGVSVRLRDHVRRAAKLEDVLADWIASESARPSSDTHGRHASDPS